MRKLLLAASVAALLLVATGCETIRPTGPRSNHTLVNVEVASTLGHNAIPTDPGVLAEMMRFFTR